MLGASIEVTATTAARCGAVRRATTCWRATVIAAAASTGSRHSSGWLACPPAPCTSMVKVPLADMTGPSGHTAVPNGIAGQLCQPKITSTPSSAPPAIISRAPCPPSSAGWNSSDTGPGNSDSWARNHRVAAMSVAMWPSWPQACITPWVSDAWAAPVASVTGMASMSARRATCRPPASPASVATVPMSAQVRHGIPSASRRWRMSMAVWCSDQVSSGARWSWCRQATASSTNSDQALVIQLLLVPFRAMARSQLGP